MYNPKKTPTPMPAEPAGAVAGIQTLTMILTTIKRRSLISYAYTRAFDGLDLGRTQMAKGEKATAGVSCRWSSACICLSHHVKRMK